MADECYLPTSEIFYNYLVEHDGKFRITFSISGLILELLQHYRLDVIDSFKKLASTVMLNFLQRLIITRYYFYYMVDLHTPTHYDRYYYPFATAYEVFKNYANLVAEISLIKKAITNKKESIFAKTI